MDPMKDAANKNPKSSRKIGERILFLLALKLSKETPFKKLPKVLIKHICKEYLKPIFIWKDRGVVGNIQISENNMKAKKIGDDEHFDVIMTTIGYEEGKIEWELQPFWPANTVNNYEQVYIGVTPEIDVTETRLNTNSLCLGDGIYWWANGGSYIKGGEEEGVSTGFIQKDVVKVCLDFDEMKVSFYKNGGYIWDHPLEKNLIYFPSVSIWKVEQGATILSHNVYQK
eukprot:TRINITY_DN2104_c0_g2_i1.p1 TRINITY_DN2104_c0_g2~~TRINITY_DN2104_c0_g2_i1.p1  ORF type:complete len:227 (-),score=69.60 TRINITY_DN2104_c0_g2_i1:33-713(-)